MFENLPIPEFDAAVQEIIDSLGVREDWTQLERLPPLTRESIGSCIAAIAEQIGLPVRFEVSYVPKDYKAAGTAEDGRVDDGFHSHALVKTDGSGRGIDGITAQVLIPSDLPFFGSPSMKRLVLRVKLSEGCWLRRETLVLVLAHEMSHVVLRSLRHPRQDSELHTDLVPLVMGFRHVVGAGRVIVSDAGGTRYTTTTFGYLSEDQFDRANDKVARVIEEFRTGKEDALECASAGTSLLEHGRKWLDTFQDCLQRLDASRPKRMNLEASQKIVECHMPDYTLHWENVLRDGAELVGSVKRMVSKIEYYTKTAEAEIQTARTNLERILPELRAVALKIEADAVELWKQLGVFERIRLPSEFERANAAATPPSAPPPIATNGQAALRYCTACGSPQRDLASRFCHVCSHALAAQTANAPEKAHGNPATPPSTATAKSEGPEPAPWRLLTADDWRKASAGAWVPPIEESKVLEAGDIVKLPFEIASHGAEFRELMWVAVNGGVGGVYQGVLVSAPRHSDTLAKGASISFTAQHVIDFRRAGEETTASQRHTAASSLT